MPSELFAMMLTLMVLLMNYLANQTTQVQDLATYEKQTDSWWQNITALYYSGSFAQVLLMVKQRYNKLCDAPVDCALQIAYVLPQDTHDTLDVLTDTLMWCHEYRAAHNIYQYMSDKGSCNVRMRLDDCLRCLGNHSKAIEILECIPVNSYVRYTTLGDAYRDLGMYNEAETSFLKALQIEYNNISVDVLTDYYGNPLATEDDRKEKVDLICTASPDHRLKMITVSTPSVIQCIASLGNVYSSMKQRNTAQAYYKKSLQLIDELYGKGAAVSHAADTLYNQANNYRHKEQYCDAEQCYALALNIYKEKSTGAGGASIADTLNNMGLN